MSAPNLIRYHYDGDLVELTPEAWGRTVLELLEERRDAASRLKAINDHIRSILDASGRVHGILKAECTGEPTPSKHIMAVYLSHFSGYVKKAIENRLGLDYNDRDLELMIRGTLMPE